MKKMSNYQRSANYLVKIFKAINEEYFNNHLEIPTITIQSTVGSYGHISVEKIWHNEDTSTHELNLSADYINRPIENVVATLIHEACHLWAMQQGIKDTSNRGIYHNRRFKQIAEEMGHLIISRHDVYGWTITAPSEETIDFCIRNSFDDILICRQTQFAFPGLSGGKSGSGDNTLPKRPPKPSSTRKYICPCCRNSFRATKSLNVLCLDCNEQFIICERN